MREFERIAGRLTRMRKIGVCTSVVLGLSVLFTAACFGLALYHLMVMLLQGEGLNRQFVVSDGESSISVAFFALLFFEFVATELVLLRLSLDMARGSSPFTCAHAAEIACLGAVFLIVFAVKLFDGGACLAMQYASMSFGSILVSIAPSSLVAVIAGVTCDFGSLVLAFVCFIVASIWRYAALLQKQADELV